MKSKPDAATERPGFGRVLRYAAGVWFCFPSLLLFIVFGRAAFHRIPTQFFALLSLAWVIFWIAAIARIACSA